MIVTLVTPTQVTFVFQLEARDREIQGMTALLEGGKSESLNRECCYADIERKVNKMRNEAERLKGENTILERRLKDAVAKQHEAMKRSLSLADRNKKLEEDLKHVDRMALTVESECNTTLKTNVEKINR